MGIATGDMRSAEEGSVAAGSACHETASRGSVDAAEEAMANVSDGLLVLAAVARDAFAEHPVGLPESLAWLGRQLRADMSAAVVALDRLDREPR